MMTRLQRFKYEMFVRVRDYGTAHAALFPESSAGGQTFARVAAAVAALDDHLSNRIVASAESRKVKAATRAAVSESIRTLALVARRATRPDPEATRFRIPRGRSVKIDIQTARAAGVPVWVVPTGSESADALRAAAPDRMLGGIGELPGLLAS